MSEFQLDPRLQADTHFVAESAFCKVLLMNDSRWPWLILVPRIANAVEIHDLSAQDQQSLTRESSIWAKILKELTQCKKINSGSLGNMVSQLHFHVIARNEGDPNWPAPVWGFETRVPYATNKAEKLVKQLQEAFASDS